MRRAYERARERILKWNGREPAVALVGGETAAALLDEASRVYCYISGKGIPSFDEALIAQYLGVSRVRLVHWTDDIIVLPYDPDWGRW